jgi:hypothetical protein
MSPVTRQEKLKAFGELSKLPEIQKASVFADERNCSSVTLMTTAIGK